MSQSSWPGWRWRRRRGASLRVRHGAAPGWRAWQRPLRWLGAGTALAGLALGLYAAAQKLLDPALFPLRHVYVAQPLQHLEADALRRLVQGYLGQNFFALEVSALHRDLTARPWVASAAVRRVWPDAVRVEIRERTAFAYWGRDELLDTGGQRFRPLPLPEWELPRLRGPAGHEQTLIRAYRRASGLLDAVGLAVDSLVLDQRRAWWMTLDNGMELSLGKEQFEARLRRFVAVYPKLAAQVAAIQGVDLRYTNGFAVRWRNS